jgi:hypothetical protein
VGPAPAFSRVAHGGLSKQAPSSVPRGEQSGVASCKSLELLSKRRGYSRRRHGGQRRPVCTDNLIRGREPGRLGSIPVGVVLVAACGGGVVDTLSAEEQGGGNCGRTGSWSSAPAPARRRPTATARTQPAAEAPSFRAPAVCAHRQDSEDSQRRARINPRRVPSRNARARPLCAGRVPFNEMPAYSDVSDQPSAITRSAFRGSDQRSARSDGCAGRSGSAAGVGLGLETFLAA